MKDARLKTMAVLLSALLHKPGRVSGNYEWLQRSRWPTNEVSRLSVEQLKAGVYLSNSSRQEKYLCRTTG